jgi:hypothetical protein
MAQTTIQKKKKTQKAKQSWGLQVNGDLFDKAKAELEKLAANKKKVIVGLADKLMNERGILKRTISALIARELKGYVTPQYVRQCLGEDQKYTKKRNLYIKRDAKEVAHQAQTKHKNSDMIWQIDAHSYDINDIDDYDIMLCRDIIRYQHIEIKRLNAKLQESKI